MVRFVRPALLRGRLWVLAACLSSAFALGGWATVARAAEPVPELSASSSAGSDSHDAPVAEGASGEALGAIGQDGAATADSKSGRGDEPHPGDGDESEARSELDPTVLPITDLPTGDGVGDGSQGRDDSDPPPAPGPEEGSDSKEEPQVPKPPTGRPDDKQDANDDSDPKDQSKPKDQPKPKDQSRPKDESRPNDQPKPDPPKPEPQQRADDSPPPQRYEPPPPESSEKKAPQRKKSSSKAPAALGTGASNQTASLAPAAAGGEAAAVRVEGNRFVSTGPPPPSGARPAQIAPYATVRIAGRVTRRGARVDVLSVRAPRDSRVTVRCRGRDCPTRSQSRIVSASAPVARANTRVSFRTMQRHLRGGTVLEVSVTKDGMIGKFTRFVIRAGKPPLRSDLCLAPGSVRPTRCA